MAEGGNSRDSVKEVLKQLEATLGNCCRQLPGTLPERENLEFDLSVFWKNFVDATKLVSHEATKLCMAFEGEGLSSSEQAQCLSNKVEHSCMSLLVVFLTLPKAKGKTLYKEIHNYVSDVIQGMKKLVSAIIHELSSQLHCVGDVWELCEEVEGLSRDNRDAVLAVCREQHDMLSDASQELVDTITNGVEGEGFELSLVTPLNGLQIPPVPSWSDSDRNVLLPCSGLMKASKACVKKTIQAISGRGDANSEATINELDAVIEIVQNCSSLADDFVLALYPPMDHSLAREQASQVRNNSKNLLELVSNSHFCSEGDETWIEFLGKALDHNWVRINDMVLAD